MTTVLKIPLDSGIADQSLDIALDGQPLTLRVTWNERAEYWYLSISHRGGETILNNIKMVSDMPLIKRYCLSIPAGEFIFLDNNNNRSRPDFFSLGKQHLLVYRPKNIS